MIFLNLQFLIILGAIAQLRTGKLCYLDTGKMEKMASIKGDKIYVISLSNKNSCAIFNVEFTFNYDNAERKCSMLSGGSFLKRENIDDLRNNKEKYANLPGGSWYLFKTDNQCPMFDKVTETITNLLCTTKIGFACQYPYQYNCAYEIVAKIDQTNIVYDMPISQNSDVTGKFCPPTLPEQKKCLGGAINPWGIWSDCSQDCTSTSRPPATKYRLQSILCKNTGPETIICNNATCNTEFLCQNGPEKSATSGNEGSDFTNVLVWVILGFAVLVVILSMVLGVLWHFRKRIKKSSGGQSMKSAVGKVQNVQDESNAQAIDESATSTYRSMVSVSAGTVRGVCVENNTEPKSRSASV